MLSAPVCHLSVSHQIQAVRCKYCVHNCKLTHFQNRIFKITMSTASLPLCTHLHKSSRQRPTRLGYIYALEHDQELSIGIQVLSKTAMEGLRTQLPASPTYSLWNPTAGESCGNRRAEQKALEGRGRRLCDIILHSKCRWICQAGSNMEKRCLMYHMSSLLSLTHFNYP